MTPTAALRRRVPWAGTPSASMVALHAEESAFLWLLRDQAVHAPHYRLNELRALDERIEANLQGVRLAGATGLSICSEVLEHSDAGEVFTHVAAVVAAGDRAAFEAMLAVAIPLEELRRGLVSALAWLPWETAKNAISSLLGSKELLQQAAAIAALGLRRIDPGSALKAALEQDNQPLRTAALRAVGLLGRLDLLGRVKAATVEESIPVQCAAAWSGAVLGSTACTKHLYELTGYPEAPWREELVRLTFRRSGDEGPSRLRELARHPRRRRDAVLAAGALGDPALVPWLIERMAEPDLARVAGEAFAEVTGAHFERDQLWRDAPADIENVAEPTSDSGSMAGQEPLASADAITVLTPDRDLYWPDIDKVKRWWVGHHAGLQKGERYLVGRTLTPASLRDCLDNGYQRHRAAAALESVALQRGQPLPEVRAPAYRKK